MSDTPSRPNRRRPIPTATPEPEPPPRPAHRPPFEPTHDQRQMVLVMAGTMVPHATIARNLGGLSVNTLKKYFAAELENGREQLVASLKGQMVRAAQNGNLRAIQWLLERLGGPEFAPRLRLGGIEDAPPIQISAESKVTVYLPTNGRDLPKEGNGHGSD